MSEPICVCGCTEAEHDVTHEKSHYPEFRTIETWEACERHQCTNFRPVLPWPDSEGWFWCNEREGLVKAFKVGREYFVVCGALTYSESAWETPIPKFIAVLEQNPFGEQ